MGYNAEAWHYECQQPTPQDPTPEPSSQTRSGAPPMVREDMKECRLIVERNDLGAGLEIWPMPVCPNLNESEPPYRINVIGWFA